MSDPKPPPPGDGLIAQRAAVIPRGHPPQAESTLPIDTLLLPLIRTTSKGIILLTAPHGGGKTTTLRHLRAILPPDTQVGLFDVNQTVEAMAAAMSGVAVLATSPSDVAGDSIALFTLSPWTLDDCMEYLLAAHRSHCTSVLSRLGRDPSLSILDGSPQLLTLVIDAMANDPSLESSREILRHYIQQIIPSGPSLDRLILAGPSYALLSAEQLRWWRHECVRKIRTADWIAGRLCQGIMPSHLDTMDDGADLVVEIAAALRHQPDAVDRLERFIREEGKSPTAAMVASILLAVNADWRPADARGLNLYKAQLAGARWAGLDLAGASLVAVNLAGADLSGADLSNVKADDANFTGANFHCARLGEARLVNAILISADLSEASASKADFSNASLESANLRDAIFHKAHFMDTDMNSATAESADFFKAWFRSVNFEHTDLAGANFALAKMDKVDLTQATWTAARFTKAEFRDCNFEGLEIPSADFNGANLTGCLLTGSRMPDGSFRRANLTRAGLADIEWENSDLRGADFTHASFHLGSTRGGLVGSTIPCEGSRTGFYTDDFNDQSYKSPEEIRKANLYGANLLGANVEKTDFYLVDLRRAIYSESQARHFSKSGAILRSVKA